jgi:KTSC domain
MADRQGGLGDFGRTRARRNLFDTGRASAAEQLFGGRDQVQDQAQQTLRGGTTTPWSFPDSSRVKAYSYDATNQQLRVRFHKYNTPWVYNGVPLGVFMAFDASPSKGMFVNSTLNYSDHRRATAEEELTHFNGV